MKYPCEKQIVFFLHNFEEDEKKIIGVCVFIFFNEWMDIHANANFQGKAGVLGLRWKRGWLEWKWGKQKKGKTKKNNRKNKKK